MVTVKIDEEVLLNALLDRVLFWNHGKKDYSYRVYKQYYEELLEMGCFDGAKFDVQEIVDNDWVNNYSTYEHKQDAIDDFPSEYWRDDRILAEVDDAVLIDNR